MEFRAPILLAPVLNSTGGGGPAAIKAARGGSSSGSSGEHCAGAAAPMHERGGLGSSQQPAPPRAARGGVLTGGGQAAAPGGHKAPAPVPIAASRRPAAQQQQQRRAAPGPQGPSAAGSGCGSKTASPEEDEASLAPPKPAFTVGEVLRKLRALLKPTTDIEHQVRGPRAYAGGRLVTAQQETIHSGRLRLVRGRGAAAQPGSCKEGGGRSGRLRLQIDLQLDVRGRGIAAAFRGQSGSCCGPSGPAAQLLDSWVAGCAAPAPWHRSPAHPWKSPNGL